MDKFWTLLIITLCAILSAASLITAIVLIICGEVIYGSYADIHGEFTSTNCTILDSKVAFSGSAYRAVFSV